MVPADEARKIRDEKRLRSLGVARPQIVGEAGIPAEVEGTPGHVAGRPGGDRRGFEGRTALLSPFDRLIHNRVRALELFDFEYYLEMYKPKAKRRWGYFALPVLHHDRLVGKVDATADRKASLLQVHAVHQDVRFTRSHDRRRPRRTGGDGAMAASRRRPLSVTRIRDPASVLSAGSTVVRHDGTEASCRRTRTSTEPVHAAQQEQQ